THALPPGTEALASLKFGDRIVRVNGDTARSWNALLDHILAGPTTLRFEVAGRPEPIVVHLSDGGLATRQALAQALTRPDPPRLGLFEPGRPAIRAGLRPGDLLVRANGDTVRSRPCARAPRSLARFVRRVARRSAPASQGCSTPCAVPRSRTAPYRRWHAPAGLPA